MRPKTVLILLILVVGLGAFIELFEGDLPSSDERAALGRRVLAIEPDAIRAIELTGGLGRVELRRGQEADGGADWVMESPFQSPADNELVGQSIDDLLQLEKQRTLEGVERSTAGLDPPRLVVSLTTDTDTKRLEIGSEIPASDTMIVALAGQEGLFVVEDRIWDEWNRDPGDWRRRNIFPGTRDQIESVTLRDRAGSIELVANEGSFWLDRPVTDRADSQRVEALLAALVSLRIEAFLDDPAITSETGALGFDPPQLEIEVVLRDAVEPFQIGFGAPVPEVESRYYATTPGRVFETGFALAEFRDTDPGVWRSRSLTALKTFEIDGLEIHGQQGPDLSLQRAGADWQRNDAVISFPTVSELIYDITDLDAVDLVDSPDHSQVFEEFAADAALRLTLIGAGREETLAFGDPVEDGVVPVRVDDRDVELFVDTDQFTELLDKLGAVRAADPVKGHAGE